MTQAPRFGVLLVSPGAVRPENRVTARSKLPQKKCTGLTLPRNRDRNRVNTRSTCTRARQNRLT